MRMNERDSRKVKTEELISNMYIENALSLTHI